MNKITVMQIINFLVVFMASWTLMHLFNINIWIILGVLIIPSTGAYIQGWLTGYTKHKEYIEKTKDIL